MSEYVDDCPDHDYYPPPGSDVSCPSCACADLRAKLQAAEEALFTANRDRQGWEDEAKLFLGQRDALQAEVARLKKGDKYHEVCTAREIQHMARITELEAEVARLKSRVIPKPRGHIGSADCWCGPTVEEHPDGVMIINHQTH